MSTEQGQEKPRLTAEDQVVSSLRKQIQELSTSVEELRSTAWVRIQAAVWAAVIMAAVLTSTATTWLIDFSSNPNYLPEYEQSRSFSLWDAPGAHQGLYQTPAAGPAGLVIASLLLMLVVSTVAAGTFRAGWAMWAGVVAVAAFATEVYFGTSMSGQSTEIGSYHTGAGLTVGIVATVALAIWAFTTAVVARRRTMRT
jgi:hypothetical protein